MRTIKNSKRIIGDKGSTLITVIVAIAFVTILTTIILGSSLMNFRMKAIDRRTKDDFYYAEKALNDIYTGIGQETALVAGQEYDNAFKNVGTVVGGVDYSMSEEAEKVFKKKFIEKAAAQIKASDLDGMKTLFQSYIVPVTGITCTVDKIGSISYELYDGTTATADTAERIRIKDVQVKSKDSRDFVAVISTDIIIETPTMDFLSASVDVTDYSIIANKGLYINGDATINGNVYAGLHAKNSVEVGDGAGTVERISVGTKKMLNDDAYGAEKLYGGINIKGKASGGSDVKINGNYITSKGDINLSGTMPKLTVGNAAVAGVSDANLPNVYFDTIRTVDGATLDKTEDVLNLNANIYALNDLELNADNSKVTITGNYYGYNDKTLPDPSKKEPGEMSFSFDSGHDDADSSAIIINGSHSTLDMSKIRSLVLMGRAYVDFSKGANSGQSIGGSEVSNVAATAEAVALKTNQQLYLVPTDLLMSPNPVLEDEYGTGFELAETKDEYGMTIKKIEKWFGYDFIDTTNIFKTYKVTMTGGSPVVYYAYLNFNDKLWVKDDTKAIGYRDVSTDSNYRPLGTHGSVSSMEAFFDIIMSSKAKHDQYVTDKKNGGMLEEDAESAAEAYELSLSTQPTPYTSYKRIVKSMGYEYFDLQDCIIGDSTDSAILYSQNAVVSYKTEKDSLTNEVKKNSDGDPIFESKMLQNKVGMERYANYPQNLYHRYQWLGTWLNAHQDITLENDPNSETRYSGLVTNVKSEWKGDGNGYMASNDAPPLSHYVALDKIIGKTIDTTGSLSAAEQDGLSRNAYGDCIIKNGDLTIGTGGVVTVGGTFKGIAIVNGNITVKAGTVVNGLLMATGVIVIEDGATVNYDKGLIQARIEKEIAIIKESDEGAATPYKPYYLITYLFEDRPTGNNSSEASPGDNNAYRKYKVAAGSKKKIDRIEADYHDFMFYENWKKGPTD